MDRLVRAIDLYRNNQRHEKDGTKKTVSKQPTETRRTLIMKYTKSIPGLILIITFIGILTLLASCGQPDNTPKAEEEVGQSICEGSKEKKEFLASFAVGDTLKPCENESVGECNIFTVSIGERVSKSVTYSKYDTVNYEWCYYHRFTLDKDNIITGIATQD